MRRVIFILFVLTTILTCLNAYAQNKVLSLDGDGDYVEIPDDNSLDLTNALTLEGWVLPDSDFGSIICKGYTAESYGLWVWHDFYVGFVHNYPESGWWSKSDWGTGKYWSHLAISWDGQTVKFFINGELAGEKEFSDILILNDENLFIGANFPGGNNDLKAFIDEVRIWNIARTQEQIQATMNTTLTGLESGLVGYWNFDDGTANDLTANNNDGTLYGDAKILDQYFVSPSGDDSNNGSKEHPFRTIQYAISQSGRNDIITALPGTYEENITLVSDLVLQGSGADETTITASSGNVVTASDVHNVTLSGFTIDGRGTADNGILCSGTTSYMEIRNNTVKNATYGIQCTDSAEPLIEDNTICKNAEYGIFGSDSVDVTIDGNSLEYNDRYGIACNGDATVSIINNDIRHNHKHGVYCWDEANVTIEYNVISENKLNGVHCQSSSTVTLISNTIQYNQYHGTWFEDDSVVVINNNLIQSNKNRGIVVTDSADTTIIRNIIRNNQGGAIDCWKSTIAPLIGGSLDKANYIIENYGRKGIYNDTSNTINATYNYWGTDDESEIENMMSNEGDGSIIFKPFIGDPELIGNVSGSGGITAYDASLILQYCVGLIDHLPANISSIASNITPRNRTISIPNVSVKPNELISVPVVIDEPEDLIAGGITIKYDTEVLKATGVKVTPESILNNTYWKSKVDNNEIRFAFSKDYSEEPNNSKTIAILEFEAISSVEGITTDLVIDHAQIAESLSIAKVDGHITFLPSKTVLMQNYPNPFNPDTWIPFKLSDDANVVISIYDISGQAIRKIGLGKVTAGMYVSKEKAVYWDGKNSFGEKVSSGLYFYTIQAGEYSKTKRMLILK